MHEETKRLSFLPGQTQTHLYSHRSSLEALRFGFKLKRNSAIRVAKTKELISFAVITELNHLIISPSAVGLSPTWGTFEKSQVLLAGVPGGFSPIFAPPTDWPVSYELK